MKVESAALFLEPTVLIILSFLKPSEPKEIEIRKYNPEKDEYELKKEKI